MDDSPTKALLDQLRRDAREAAAQRIAAAQAETERIRVDASARVAQQRTAALAERAHAHTAALERLRSDTRARTAREWLTARAEALDRIFAAANEALLTRSKDAKFQAAVTAGARDALAYLPAGDALARCTADLAPAARAAFEPPSADARAISVTADDHVATGVIFETTDHTLTVDATFARRLARERTRLAIEVVRQLERTAP
jgi:vacuolar-type H+-ATPase subunit E/Vma4